MYQIQYAFHDDSLDVLVCALRNGNETFGTFVMLGSDVLCDATTLPIEFEDRQHLADRVRDALETAVGADEDFFPAAFAAALCESDDRQINFSAM